VDLVDRLRDVLPFANARDLVEQMRADVELARRILTGPVSGDGAGGGSRPT
jgi:FAD synthase